MILLIDTVDKRFIWSLMLLDTHFQMLRDTPKARQEVELHCRASVCPRIVGIEDVFENYYQGKKCLLLIMEW